jgi:predicted chitinase
MTPFTLSTVTPVRIAPMFPHARGANIRANLPHVLAGLQEFGLTDRDMCLMALATIRAETAGFEPIPEGKSKYNTAPGGEPFALYDNRKDIGNIAPGDGYRFRGRGYVQITGRDNYKAAGKALKLDLINKPDLALDPATAGRILAWFLKSREDRIRRALAREDLAAARRAVNGGSHGLMPFTEAWAIGKARLW